VFVADQMVFRREPLNGFAFPDGGVVGNIVDHLFVEDEIAAVDPAVAFFRFFVEVADIVFGE